MPLLLFLFVAVPVIEIGLFIQVGGLIGFWPTMAIVLVTAFLGSYLVRAQGALALNQVRDSFQNMTNPSEPLAHGAMILLSGALLLTPGFFTDAVGFALLVPPVRRWMFEFLRKRVKVQSFTVNSQTTYGRTGPRTDDDVIDGEFEDVTPDKRPTHPPINGSSGWTKH